MCDITEFLQVGTPFALLREPDGAPTLIMASHPEVSFSIYPWLSRIGFVLDGRCSPIESLGLMPQLSEKEYVVRVGGLIARLKQRGGKTVYSRIINGTGALRADEIAKRLMDLDQKALRIMWYHPSTGLWEASTPELLLDVDLKRQRFRTMSLAGTRQAGSIGSWDNKNIVEQQIVTDTIVDSLNSLGLSAEISPVCTLRSGGVEHRCTMIEGRTGGVAPNIIASVLSPTPALGGYPRNEALADIAELEVAPRECYGGYVAISDSNRWRAYVVLRCARIDLDGNYRLYAGGGITADSDPEKEWCETVAKSRTISNILGV
ncbi:MAG: chorismate-binding protein [Muribaculaceae bacterium]|nr:chorismate-binding protein [Muribaculaceae bacterium]